MNSLDIITNNEYYIWAIKVISYCVRHQLVYKYHTKNRLVLWSNDKELSLSKDIIGWNSLSKKKKKKASI